MTKMSGAIFDSYDLRMPRSLILVFWAPMTL